MTWMRNDHQYIHFEHMDKFAINTTSKCGTVCDSRMSVSSQVNPNAWTAIQIGLCPNNMKGGGGLGQSGKALLYSPRNVRIPSWQNPRYSSQCGLPDQHILPLSGALPYISPSYPSFVMSLTFITHFSFLFQFFFIFISSFCQISPSLFHKMAPYQTHVSYQLFLLLCPMNLPASRLPFTYSSCFPTFRVPSCAFTLF
jgi:hypothetical protein